MLQPELGEDERQAEEEGRDERQRGRAIEHQARPSYRAAFPSA